MVEDRFENRRFARLYRKSAATAEQRGGAEHRSALLDGLSGRVVEVGAGHGLNFPHYPPEVTELIAVEPEDTLRADAERAAAGAPVAVRVVAGVADRLPVEDGWADAVVFSLVLCSVPDQASALAEARRVLRAGGELRFYEHVIAEPRLLAGLMKAGDAVWPHVAGGCHMSRDTGTAIAAAGFDVVRSERVVFRAGALMPPIPHILGRAVSR